jgi:UDP-N-acetylglucosamine 3-dehydrogenase
LNRPKIGVIGLGYWGNKIAREYLTIQRRFGGLTLAAVCDLDKDRIETFRHHHGYPLKRLFSNIDDFLASEVQGVHVCTPNASHFDIAISALDLGKAVLVEKPMTTSYRDAKTLVKQGARLGLPVMAGHIYRFNAAVKRAANLVHAETLGKIRHIKIEWKALATFRDPQRDIIFDLAPHPFDITNMLIDEWPLKVKYSLHDPRNVGVNEIAYIQATYRGQTSVHIELSWAYVPKTRAVLVIGDRRSLQLDCLNQNIHLYHDSRKSKKVIFERNNAMRAELIHFAKYCTRPREPLDLEKVGLRVVEILDTAAERKQI